MGLGDGVLELPRVLGLLSERDELLGGRNGEDPQVLVLGAIIELDMPLPGREICASGRKAEFDDVWELEFLEQLGAFSLEDAHTADTGFSRIE